MMALVHDLAEAQGDLRVSHIRILSSFFKVGDIAPSKGIPKAEKHRLEGVKGSYYLLILALIF